MQKVIFHLKYLKAFNHLWRMCESYELWCKESKQKHLIYLKITD